MTNVEATHEPEVPKSLRRSRGNRWVAGVSGGLAEYFGLNAAVYRVLFVALALAGGTGILLYLAAALVMPAEDRDESALTETLRNNRDRPWLVIGMALLALLLLFVLSEPGPDGSGPFWFWPGALVFWALVGGAVVLAVRAVRRGRRGILAVIAAVVVVLGLAVAGTFAAAHDHGGVGDRVERPLAASELEDEYRLGFGELELDLREVALPRGETRVEATIGVGELTVILPPDVPVSLTAEAAWGEVNVLGRSDGDRDRVVDPGFDDAETRLVLDARVRGPGELTVRR
jgi:phage shock protein PspC (stress-responsive transcriptional regulator)